MKTMMQKYVCGSEGKVSFIYEVTFSNGDSTVLSKVVKCKQNSEMIKGIFAMNNNSGVKVVEKALDSNDLSKFIATGETVKIGIKVYPLFSHCEESVVIAKAY